MPTRATQTSAAGVESWPYNILIVGLGRGIHAFVENAPMAHRAQVWMAPSLAKYFPEIFPIATVKAAVLKQIISGNGPSRRSCGKHIEVFIMKQGVEADKFLECVVPEFGQEVLVV